ncbi:MAG: DnaB-like helicase N-terminal domain-containing protein, partial [Nakamurella sp.]
MAADEQWKPRNATPAPVPFDRQPPQDLPAEQSVLGGMLLSKDAIADVFEVLSSADFYKPAHVHVFDAILDLYSRGEPADPITVSADLERAGLLPRVGGSVYLHHLTAMVPTAANAGFYARIVGEKAVLRRLVEAGTRIAQLGYGGAEGDAGSGEVDEIVDRAEQEMYKVAERRTTEDYIVLEELLGPTMDEIDAIQSRGGLSLGVPTGFTDLDTLTNGFHPGQMIIIAARPGVGKALALDTPLATPDGWTTMGEVAIGDRLFGADGRPTTVVAATELMAGRPCFEVEFSDGAVVVADAEHQWVTRTRADRRGSVSAGTTRTTVELRETLRCDTADGRLNHSIATTAALQLPPRELPIPPYALGVWLGDGTSASASFTSADPEISVHIGMEGLRSEYLGGMRYSIRLPAEESVSERKCLVCGVTFVPATSQVRTCGKRCGGGSRGLMPSTPKPPCPECGLTSAGGRMCMACRLGHGSVQARLRTLGVLGDKHIP